MSEVTEKPATYARPLSRWKAGEHCPADMVMVGMAIVEELRGIKDELKKLREHVPFLTGGR